MLTIENIISALKSSSLQTLEGAVRQLTCGVHQTTDASYSDYKIWISSRDVVPKCIAELRPNEQDAAMKWRIRAYRNPLRADYGDFVQKCQGVIINSQVLANAITREDGYWETFFKHMVNEYLPFALENPSGVLVSMAFLDPTETDLECIEQRFIIIEEDDALVYICPERSIYTEFKNPDTGLKYITYKEKLYCVFVGGLYYEFTDKQVEGKETVTVEPLGQYTVNPWTELYYKEVGEHEKRSIISDACEIAELALDDHSDSRYGNKTIAHPRMATTAVPCSSCHGNGYLDSGDNCGTCKGTGQIVPVGAGQVLMLPTATGLNKDVIDNRPPVQYFSPDPAAMEYVNGLWQGYRAMFREGLCLPPSKTTNQAESADALKQQKQAFRDIVKVVGQWFNEIILRVADAMTQTPNSIIIERAPVYSTMNEQEAAEQLAKFYVQGISPIVRQGLIKKWLAENLGPNSTIAQKLAAAEQASPYVYYSHSELMQMVNNGVMTPQQFNELITTQNAILNG